VTIFSTSSAIFCRCRDGPAAANPAIPLLTLRWTFPAKRASVVVTDSEPGRLAPLPRQRPVASAGFGWWRRHVAAFFLLSYLLLGLWPKACNPLFGRASGAQS